MNSRPMILRFSSGSHDPLERPEELVAGLDHVEGVEDCLEVAAYLLGLAEPHHPVVDVDAGQPVADGALHDRRRHRGVDATRQRADRPALADLGADRLDLLLDDVDHGPGGPAAGDLEQEVFEHLLAVLGVQHLGVPLDAGEPRPTSSNAATGVPTVEASSVNPAGAAVTESPWDIQTLW